MHREIAEVPYHCSLCGFKAFNQSQLDKHIYTFPLHSRIKAVQRPNEPDSHFYVVNKHPREIVCGVDYEELPSQQSRDVWASKQRGKPAVASTVKVVERSVLPKVPSYHTRPASTNTSTLASEATLDSTPSVAMTTPNDSTLPPSTTVSVNQLIKNLQGQVDADVLEKAMTLSGIPSSPSFSHLSEPTCELFEQEDPLWQEPIVTPPTNTPVPVPSSDLAIESQLALNNVENQEQNALQAMQKLLDNITDPAAEQNQRSPPHPSTTSLTTSTPSTAAENSDSTAIRPESSSVVNSPVDASTETSISTCDQATNVNPTEFCTSECGTQTLSLETIIRPIMADMMKESMMVFAQVMGHQVKQMILEADPAGAQHALIVTNQNLAQLADVIKAQNRLIQQERAKLGEGAFIKSVKELTESVNDLRADFRSYQSRPASESEHKRTASALDAVVAGIHKVVQRQQDQQKAAEMIPMAPSTSNPQARLSMFDQSEFNKMIDEAMNRETNISTVKTIEDRRKERCQPQPSTSGNHPLQSKPISDNQHVPSKSTSENSPLQIKATNENGQSVKDAPSEKKKKRATANKENREEDSTGKAKDSTTKKTTSKGEEGQEKTVKKSAKRKSSNNSEDDGLTVKKGKILD